MAPPSGIGPGSKGGPNRCFRRDGKHQGYAAGSKVGFAEFLRRKRRVDPQK